jgi:hypothetical protein
MENDKCIKDTSRRNGGAGMDSFVEALPCFSEKNDAEKRFSDDK